MSAANVPSRARAHARPPGDSPVTYVRMVIQLTALASPSLAAGSYAVRWTRAGQNVKTTAAHRVPGPMPDKLSLYARVRRDGDVFVPEDRTDTLATEIHLVPVAEGSSAAPVDAPSFASVEFDVADVLHRIVQQRVKSIPTSLVFPPDVTVSATVTIKAIGENHLRPIATPAAGAASLSPTGLAENDEAVAARELERLRHDVREREGRLEELAQSTEQLDRAVQQHAALAEKAAPAADVAALQVRLNAVEEQRAVAERERADAERRVAAHVAHAEKIKSTYNQLAAWYNNLRKEHADLQEKHPQTVVEQASASNLPEGVSTTHEADLRSLERERNELKQMLERERSEKKDMYSRNSELLESKARTMAELRHQWDSTQNALTHSKKATQEQGKQVSDLQETVNCLEASLREKERQLGESVAALAKAEDNVKSFESKHSEDVAQERSRVAEEADAYVRREIQKQAAQHEEHIRKLKFDSNAACAAAVELERKRMEALRQEELSNTRREAEEQLEAKYQKDARLLQEKLDKELEAKSELAEKLSSEAHAATKLLDERTAESESQRSVLQDQICTLKESNKARDLEHENAVKVMEAKYQEELEIVQTARGNAEEELRRLQDASSAIDKVKVERELGQNSRVAALEQDLSSAQAELDSLRSENEKLKDSSERAMHSEEEKASTVADLRKEVARLSSLVKIESDKRHETANLLASADNEHDELRAMVSRLRSERDEALKEAEHAREVIPNPKVSVGVAQRNALGGGQETDAGSFLEERDKAIRELFRVRKGLNKEIKILKKDNFELSAQLDKARGHGGEIGSRDLDAVRGADNSNLWQEKDAAVSELRNLHSFVAPLAGKDAPQDDKLPVTEVGSQIRSDISALAAEHESCRAKSDELESSLSEAIDVHKKDMVSINRENENLRNETKQLSSSIAKHASNLQNRDAEISSLKANLESLNRGLDEAVQSRDEAVSDRDEFRARSAALHAELNSLRKSMEIASSSSSSTEVLLQGAQSELAESKRAVNLLQSELNSTKEAAELRCSNLQREVSRLEAAAAEHSSLSRDLANEIDRHKAELAQERRTYESKGLARQSEITQSEALIQQLKSERIALEEKLADDERARGTLETQLSSAEKRAQDLETQLESQRESNQSNVNMIRELSSEKNGALSELSDAKGRLEELESQLVEQHGKLSAMTDRLKSAEASRDTLEKNAHEVGNVNQAASAEVAKLREELERVRAESDIITKELDEARESAARLSTEKEAATRSLGETEDSTSAKLAAVESRLESTEDELRVIRESYSTLEGVLEKVEQKSGKLGRTASERAKEIVALKSQLAETTSANQHAKAQYEGLADEHQEMSHELAQIHGEISKLQNEKASLSKQMEAMLTELDAVRSKMLRMQEEHEEAIAAERFRTEKEAKRVIEARKELQSACDAADALQSEAEQLRASNMELIQESELSKENTSGRDQEVLSDLINTRMELAYAQEETIRLRNKLKKVGQSGQGNSSFEH